MDFPSDDEASLQQRDVLLHERGGINGLQAGDDIDPNDLVKATESAAADA